LIIIYYAATNLENPKLKASSRQKPSTDLTENQRAGRETAA